MTTANDRALSRLSPLKKALLTFVLLALIVFVAAKIRLFHVMWDEGTDPHPDERFLVSFVVANLRVPQSFGDYLTANCPSPLPAPRNPEETPDRHEPSLLSGCSTLNPRNFNSSRFFVYGSFPTTLNRVVSEMRASARGLDTANVSVELIRQTGRELSALFDTIAVVLVFLIGLRLYGRRAGLLAALLYAFAPMAIQQAHFFTTDSFAACFGLLATYCGIRLSQAGRRWWLAVLWSIGMGVAIGFAMGSKVTLLALVGLAGLALLMWAWRSRNELEAWYLPLLERLGLGESWVSLARALSPVLRFLGVGLVGGLAIMLAFHIASPDAFENPGLLSFPKINERFQANLDEVGQQVNGDYDAPFALQWTARSKWVFPLKNMLLWGMGLGLGLVAWASWAAAAWQLLRRNLGKHLLLVVWVGAFFFWQGGQWVKAMRYLLPIYGALCVLAAWGIVEALRWARERPAAVRVATRSLAGLAVVATLLWGWGFSRIYARPTPRLAAAQWLEAHTTPNSVIAFESWDEGLPIHFSVGERPETRPHSAEDNQGKIQELLSTLARSDYLAIVSQRGFGSTERLPMRYPATNRYYEELFKCSPDVAPEPCPFGFELVADFNSHPTFLGYPLNDQLAAEEAFSVYDHQRVMIFKRRADFDAQRAYQLIAGDIAFSEIYQLWAIPATQAPTALRLTQEQWQVQTDAGSWADSFGGLTAQFPLLFWLLLVELLGLAMFSLLFRLRLPLPDRGLSLARPLSMVFVAYVGWLLASVRIVTFSRPLLVGLALLLLAGGALAWRRQRAELSVFWHERRGAIIASQLVYFLAFGLFLLIRYLNPDLWHPNMGGERPMELAYTHAILRSSYFPPYDPWFAGGYMNYYYWGFLLVGTPMKLLGIAPEIGFNLAIPMVYGWTALGAFGVAYNLLAPLRRSVRRAERRALLAACAAPLFLALLGNLAQIPLYVNGLREIGTPDVALFTPEHYKNGLWVDDAPVGVVGPAIDGLQTLLDGDEVLPFRPEWPYWNATRVVKDTINEFPFFSFLYGDLHAHVIALPLTLVALMLAVGLLRSVFGALPWPGRTAPGDVLRSWLRVELRGSRAQIALLLMLGLMLGALQAANTWDYLTYMAVAVAALGVATLRGPAPPLTRLLRFVWMLALLLLASRLFFKPWTDWFVNAYDRALRPAPDATIVQKLLARLGVIQVEPHERMVGREFLAIYGVWAFIALSYAILMSWRAVWRRGKSPVLLALLGGSWAVLLLGGYYAISQGATLTLLTGLALVFGALFYGALSGVFSRRHIGPICLGLAAFLILLVSEIVVVPGAGRMNTVFKFTYQVWTLVTLACALALPTLFDAMRRVIFPARWVWRLALSLLLIAGLLYPVTATRAKVNDRYKQGLPHTLDGSAFMREAEQQEEGQLFPLSADRAAIEWMRENIPGTPIVAEAHLSPYRYGSRIAIWTGLPTVVGWDVHQDQQRQAVNARQVIDSRINALRELYTVPLRDRVLEILRTYGVGYIYVGPLERAAYQGDANASHFDTLAGEGLLSLVYNQQDVRIYQVIAAGLPLVLHDTPNVTPPPDLTAQRLMLPERVNQLAVVDGVVDGGLLNNQWLALLVWLLVFELLGLLALPIAALIFRRRHDLGWGWSKLIGLLLWSYLVWLPVSLKIWQFNRQGVLLGLGLLLLLSLGSLWLIGRRNPLGARQPAPAPRPRRPSAIGDLEPADEPAPALAATLEEQPSTALRPLALDELEPALAASLEEQPGAATRPLAEEPAPALGSRLDDPLDTSTWPLALDVEEQSTLASLQAEGGERAVSTLESYPAELELASPEQSYEGLPANGNGYEEYGQPGDPAPTPPSLLAEVGGPIRAGLAWLSGELSRRRARIVLVESLFLAIFAFFAIIRAFNPDLWDPTWGGEKPFEFGLLNAILRSPSMPPYDPFYADGIVNYYYYGLFMVALPVKLLGLDPAIAFNLIIPLLGGLVAVATLSVVAALTRNIRWALVGVLLLLLAGNLGGGLAYGDSTGLSGIVRSIRSGELVSTYGEPWFWGPSRIIYSYMPGVEVGVDGKLPVTINEFPLWSLLFADLHPHLIALPLTILLIGLAWELAYPRPWRQSLGALLLVPLTLGTIYVSNSWDLPAYAAIVVGALLLRGLVVLRRERQNAFALMGWPAPGWRSLRGLISGPLLGVLLVGLSLVLFLPFLGHYWVPVKGIGRVPETHLSPLLGYLVIYGLFLAVIGSSLALLQIRASHTQRLWLIMGLASVGVLGMVLVPAYQTAIVQSALLIAVVWTFFQRQHSPALRFSLLLVGVGLLIGIFVELVYIRDHLAPGPGQPPGDNIRMNTVFKFGYQVWTLFALAAAALLPRLFGLLRRLPTERGPALFIRGLAAGLGVVLLTTALIFTIVGPLSRIATRANVDTGPTLDGLAFMEQLVYQVDGNPVSMADDKAAIDWMRQNLEGAPVVLQSDREFYRAYGVRIAANTGLPTVLGRLHQDEQRPADGVYSREGDVRTIYETTDAAQALHLLGRYHVDYVYVGAVERISYGAPGVDKFATMEGLREVYSQGQARLYQVDPAIWSRARDPLFAPVSQPQQNPFPQPPEVNTELAMLEATFQSNPSDAGAAFALAQAYAQDNRFDEATAVLRRAASANPHDVPLRHILGDMHDRAGQREQAEAAYREAIAINVSADNLSKLGQGFMEWGDLDAAETQFKLALEKDPAAAIPHYLLGELASKRGDIEGAKQRFRTFLDMTEEGYPYHDVATRRLAELEK